MIGLEKDVGRMLRIMWLIQIAVLVSFQAMAAIPSSPQSIKGYHEWKSEKIQNTLNQISTLKAQITKAQADSNKKQIEAFENQLDQLKWNLEVSEDLSVTDYFVLYLSQQTANDRFQQAAQKISTKEVAELMEAYSNTLGSSPADLVAKPAAQPRLPGKLPAQAIQGR